MRRKRICLAFLCSFLFFSLFPVTGLAKPIRTVVIDDGQVIRVNTALGFSTILEFSSKPISAVLGDQDSFKLEYVGNSITIKPLVSHARSNLFIFTEFERFNCQVSTTPPALVDYIVRIRAKPRGYSMEFISQDGSYGEPASAAQPLRTTSLQKSSTYDGITLTLKSISRSYDLRNPRNVTLISFEISSRRKSYSFQAGSIGARQLGQYINMESIYIDGLELMPGAPPIHGKIALLAQDYRPSMPLTIVFAMPDRLKKSSVHRIEVTTINSTRSKQRDLNHR